MPPRVSVLIPCFNAEKVVGETLDSVFRQTWPNIEVILVDDGSEDGSVAEAQRFASRGLTILRQPNRGASAARNAAFSASSGELIQFLDCDDIIDPSKISIQMDRLGHNRTCVASAEWGRFYHDPREVVFKPEPVWADMDPVDWLVGARADGQGMLFPALWLIPRPVAAAAGPWDEDLTLGDDGEYFTRIVLAADRVLFCEGARCRYRSGIPSSLSGRRSPASFASAFRVLDLCESHMRAREDSGRVRHGLALSWQHLAHSAYPYDPVLAERALTRARAVHDVIVQPDGGRAFKLATRLVGWRTARRLQVASGRQ